MTEYITQELALGLAHKRQPTNFNERWTAFNTQELVIFVNEIVQHYKDSQPKPASVKEIMGLADKYRDLKVGHGTAKARADLSQAITQQAAQIQESALKQVSLFGELQNALEQIAALKKEVSTLDVLLEECKMDWSGDVTQIKAEHD